MRAKPRAPTLTRRAGDNAMSWIVEHIDWVLIVSGALTFGAIVTAFAPRFISQFVFGEVIEGKAGDLALRILGEMVAASGLMLIYAAYHPEVRLPILLYSIVGKTTFIVVTLLKGFRGPNAMLTVAADGAMIVLFAWYLIAV